MRGSKCWLVSMGTIFKALLPNVAIGVLGIVKLYFVESWENVETMTVCWGTRGDFRSCAGKRRYFFGGDAD